MTTDTTAAVPTSAPDLNDDHVDALVVDAPLRIAVVDAGQKRLPYDHDRSPVRRNGWAAQFDSKTDTVIVHRDAEKSVLGHTPMPAFPPLSEAEAQRVAREIRDRALDRRLDNESLHFYDDSDALEVYFDEVAAAIQHPAWCERGACWDRQPTSFVEHTRTAGAYAFASEHDRYSAQAALHLYAEFVEPDPDEKPVVELRIGPQDATDILVLDNLDDLRKLGQYLITAANDLEREQDGS